MTKERLPQKPLFLAQGFAEHVVAWSAYSSPEHVNSARILAIAAHAASESTSSGHVCTNLSDICKAAGDVERSRVRDLLLDSGVVGTSKEHRGMPLILDDADRLFLHRYYDYERRLAKRILQSAGKTDDVAERMKSRLEVIFPSTGRTGCDWQKVAAALALRNRLTVISGGPGVGKTTTVVGLLACLLEQRDCRIALAAPTGKAAARMQESLRERAIKLGPEISSRLPTESFTIHRLLGVLGESGEFKHNRDNPLPIDVLILDEASMLDLALAVKLFEAVPLTAKIILLGDKDQLAAVEAGSVFAELSAGPFLDATCIEYLSSITGTTANMIAPPTDADCACLPNNVVWLTESYRFSLDSGIGRLANCINTGDETATLDLLRDETENAVSFIEQEGERLSSAALSFLKQGYTSYIRSLQENLSQIDRVFEEFSAFRILCAVKNGEYGVAAINEAITSFVLTSLGAAERSSARTRWYVGRPVMVQRNDYTLGLFNGDVGITLPDIEGNLLVHFPQLDGSYRKIAPGRLPEHDTAFASTIHKSQGSEFGDVAVVLPYDDSQVSCRELFYTGVTRAKRRVSVIATESAVVKAVKHRTRRTSGLQEWLKHGVA